MFTRHRGTPVTSSLMPLLTGIVMLGVAFAASILESGRGSPIGRDAGAAVQTVSEAALRAHSGGS